VGSEVVKELGRLWKLLAGRLPLANIEQFSIILKICAENIHITKAPSMSPTKLLCLIWKSGQCFMVTHQRGLSSSEFSEICGHREGMLNGMNNCVS